MNPLRLDSRSLTRLIIACQPCPAAMRTWSLAVTSNLGRASCQLRAKMMSGGHSAVPFVGDTLDTDEESQFAKNYVPKATTITAYCVIVSRASRGAAGGRGCAVFRQCCCNSPPGASLLAVKCWRHLQEPAGLPLRSPCSHRQRGLVPLRMWQAGTAGWVKGGCGSFEVPGPDADNVRDPELHILQFQ